VIQSFRNVLLHFGGLGVCCVHFCLAVIDLLLPSVHGLVTKYSRVRGGEIVLIGTGCKEVALFLGTAEVFVRWLRKKNISTQMVQAQGLKE
jgi:hypothetical protein